DQAKCRKEAPKAPHLGHPVPHPGSILLSWLGVRYVICTKLKCNCLNLLLHDTM
ncbi:hypothetical protein NDU88_002959, partial [Pleurodeles waltl]